MQCSAFSNRMHFYAIFTLISLGGLATKAQGAFSHNHEQAHSTMCISSLLHFVFLLLLFFFGLPTQERNSLHYSLIQQTHHFRDHFKRHSAAFSSLPTTYPYQQQHQPLNQSYQERRHDYSAELSRCSHCSSTHNPHHYCQLAVGLSEQQSECQQAALSCLVHQEGSQHFSSKHNSRPE